jgi:hypothetical protein
MKFNPTMVAAANCSDEILVAPIKTLVSLNELLSKVNGD